MSQALHKLSVELRSALLGGDDVLATKLACEYANAVRELWESLPEGDRAVSPIPQQATELMNWAHDMAVVRRAMTVAQLGVVQKASQYSAGNGNPRSGVQFRG